jgi:transposase InsO family protein
MPWLETDVRDQRVQFVLAARRAGANRAEVCRAFGISRKTGYKWLAREHAAHSAAALADRSRRPHHSPARTKAPLTARVVALRQQYGWGGEKLAHLLAQEGLSLAPRTIDRIIRREGLTRVDVAPAPALTRFERSAPNELWQMDAKGQYPLRPRGHCHPLSVLDDHSRYVVGLVALPALQTGVVQPALIACFERYGVPDAMLMDHGVPWWAPANGAGLTTLSVFLLNQGIRLIYGRVRHPQTQGKVERFHRTLGERLRWWGVPSDLAGFAAAFRRFRDEYNEVRPHAALSLAPPASRFVPSGRAYTPTPPPWTYPPGGDVRRLDANGMLTWKAQRLFVSAALADQEVGFWRIGQRLVVAYRHMYVRELHLRTGLSVALLKPMR